jgi:uncharacterized protein
MDTLQMIIVFVAGGTGALLQGVTGLGLNLFASPLLMMAHPGFVPGPIVAGALILTTLMLLRDRAGIDLRGVGWMGAGMLPGTALGTLLLPMIPLKVLSLLLGGLVLVGVGLSLSGLRFPPKWWVLLLAGFLSGLSNTLASIGGPPVALVNQEMEPRKLRATLSGYFILSAVTTLIGLVLIGRFGRAEMGRTAWLIPGVIVGFLASFPLAKRMRGSSSRYAVLGLSAVSALILILKQVV